MSSGSLDIEWVDVIFNIQRLWFFSSFKLSLDLSSSIRSFTMHIGYYGTFSLEFCILDWSLVCQLTSRITWHRNWVRRIAKIFVAHSIYYFSQLGHINKFTLSSIKSVVLMMKRYNTIICNLLNFSCLPNIVRFDCWILWPFLLGVTQSSWPLPFILVRVKVLLVLIENWSFWNRLDAGV